MRWCNTFGVPDCCSCEYPIPNVQVQGFWRLRNIVPRLTQRWSLWCCVRFFWRSNISSLLWLQGKQLQMSSRWEQQSYVRTGGIQFNKSCGHVKIFNLWSPPPNQVSNSELCNRLSLQTQRLELACAQSMWETSARLSSPSPLQTRSLSEKEYTDESDEVSHWETAICLIHPIELHTFLVSRPIFVTLLLLWLRVWRMCWWVPGGGTDVVMAASSSSWEAGSINITLGPFISILLSFLYFFVTAYHGHVNSEVDIKKKCNEINIESGCGYNECGIGY